MQQNEAFFRQHSDIRVMSLATFFRICQKRRANSLQEAYEHTYGSEKEKRLFFMSRAGGKR